MENEALRPRVAVMNNGTRKGGDLDSFRVLHASPGLEDLWQLHWAYNAGLENSPAMFVANMDDNATIAGVLLAFTHQRINLGGNDCCRG